MGIYNPERNLRRHRHFRLHPKSIDHIRKDFQSNGYLNHGLVTSLKERILLSLRDHKVWDKFEDAEIERLIEMELVNHLNRTRLVKRGSKQPIYWTTKGTFSPSRFPGTSILITLLIFYIIYQAVVRDFSHSTNHVQYVKDVLAPADGFLLLLTGILCILLVGPPLEKLYGSGKFFFLFIIPGFIVLPFQNGTAVEALCGCICGIMGIYFGLLVQRSGGVRLKRNLVLWGAFAIYLAFHYYMLGALFEPYTLMAAAVIGLLLSLLIKPQSYRKIAETRWKVIR